MVYRSKLRIGFWVAIGFVALLNLIFDLWIFQQNKITDESGAWVSHTATLLRDIGDLALDANESALNSIPDVNELRERVVKLEPALTDTPAQVKLSEELLALLQSTKAEAIEKTRPRIVALIMQIRQNEYTQLERRVRSDAEANQESDFRILFANVFDFVLIAACAALYFFDRKWTRAQQQALAKASRRIAAANEALVDRQKRQANFFKATVHDLKNPLGSISGLAELVRDESAKHEPISEMALMIEKASQGTLALVNRLLESSSQADGEKNFQPRLIDLCEILRGVCQLCEVAAGSKGQTLVLESRNSPLWVKADALRIQDALMNLVENAIKFSGRGTSIIVRCDPNQDRAIVEVEDEGPGLSTEDKTRAFQAGVRLSAKPTGGESSTGYGLYSARLNIEMHSGSIRVEDPRRGRTGARFVVELPLAPTNELPETRV